MSTVEALYIFDEHNNTILEHVYTGRPPSAATLLPLYLAQPSPRCSLIHLPNVNPPVLLFSIIQDRLLLLCPTSTETEPLLVLEFLHRVADALEEYLGSPVLASKIEASYDVVAQVVGEMCDAGTVCNTEPNALKEVVEAPSWMDNWFSGFGLPVAPPALAGRPPPTSFARSTSPFPPSNTGAPTSSSGSAIPWRRSNVRHTSNELYVDIVETLSVIHAPSGRPISAIANGTIAFTAKISGVPDLVLTLSAPGGKTGILHAMDLPCFHPCVRLAVWRERPGELSFVPPDGRFVLAGYECDLMPDLFTSLSSGKIPFQTLNLPASVEIRTSLGAYGEEFEARLTVNARAVSTLTPPSTATSALGGRSISSAGRFGNASPAFSATNNAPPSTGPAVEDVVVTIPVPASVRNISELRASRGEAHYLASEGIVEWRVPTKDAASIGSAGATLRCSLVGPPDDVDDEDAGLNGLSLKTDTFDYDENAPAAYQSSDVKATRPALRREASTESRDVRRVQQNAALMPRSASLSFSVRGWLASGIKVEGLTVNTKTSKGLGAGVTPYKGVKYHTVSRRGIEVRC